MTNKQKLIALYTIINHELIRMLRISSQVFLPPVITTLLYFLIFGTVVGKQIGTIQGMSYGEFLAPGLVMMSVIINSYSNVSTSLFSVRFQKSIEELLVSPMHYSSILLGFVIGGVFRGLIVGILVYFVSCFFLHVDFTRIPMTFCIVVLVATVFSLAGFANAMLARTFDDVALIPTFIITPLTYLGGVFYTTNMLPVFWQKLSYFNPILYMVTALRQAMIGHQEINMTLAMTVICTLLVLLAILNLMLMKKGVGLHD